VGVVFFWDCVNDVRRGTPLLHSHAARGNEIKEFGAAIRVNGVSPGAILWPDNELAESDKQEILQRVALGRAGDPVDIAKAVRFLIKDAEYMTGQILTVDGGRTLFC